jgi:PAS domain S-box-containing protein
MQATHPSHSLPTSSACGHSASSAQKANSDTSALQFRSMTDAMPHIVWTMQADGSYTYFNQKWLAYTGLSPADSLQHGWPQALHPDDRSRVARLSEQAMVNGQTCESECRLRHADGSYRWMLGRAVPQCDEAGLLTHWLGTFTDIDDLKQTTALLEKNLSMVRIAGRVARLGGWTIDLPERTLTWSDENCVIHDVLPGYTPTLEEGINYFLPEHREEVIRHVKACAEHGTPYEFVLPKLTAKGRRIWVRSTGEAVRDEAGKIIRLQGAFQDISEQKKADNRMRALEAQLTTTLESITDGFYVLGKDWKFIFVNSPAERMLKRRRGDLLGKSMWQEFPEAVGTSIEKHCHLTVNEQRTARFEVFYEPLSTWFDFHVYPTEAGLAVYFQDVTQRRQEQAQLRLLQKAVARLNDMVIIMEADDQDESGPRIVFVNDAFERQTGYSREDVIGRPPGQWAPKSQQSQVERIRIAMKNWQPVRAEVAIHTKPGQALWLEIDLAPIADESSRFTHWVAVNRDISERRQQQQEILSLNNELEERVRQRTAQLATANKELESFAYAVSHDLRSPLNTVDAFSQLLLKLDSENISDKGKHYLDRIGVGVRHMGELIEGLLTLAHLSRGAIRSEPVDLSALARRIDNQCSACEPGRQLQVHIQDGLHARGDTRLLLAVFQNLIDNAWKFTSRQALAQIDVGCQSGPGGETVFFVKDNGAGFDMAHAHKLFGTFERLHSPGEFPGTGIGLATVKRVIERHGGRVWAESKVNEGATFYFTLSPSEKVPA